MLSDYLGKKVAVVGVLEQVAGRDGVAKYTLGVRSATKSMEGRGILRTRGAAAHDSLNCGEGRGACAPEYGRGVAALAVGSS